MPVPAEALCRCGGELWRRQGRWHHIDAEGRYHDADPMTPEERSEYEGRMRVLVAKYAIPKRKTPLPIANIQRPDEESE